MDDIERIARRLRPDGRRTVTSLLIVLAGLLAAVAYLVTQLSAAHRRLEDSAKSAQKTQPPFSALKPPDGTTRADAVAAQAVSVIAVDKSNVSLNARVGSGILLDAGLALTARHVLTSDFSRDADVTAIRVYCHGAYREAEVLFTDRLTDLAGLSVPDCDAQKLFISARPISRTDRLHVAGFEHDDETGNPYWFHVTTWLRPDQLVEPDMAPDPELRWRMNAMAKLGLTPLMAVNAGFVHGNSGSYVFNDDGELVAMLIGNLHGPEHGVIATAQNITDALARHHVPH